MSEYIKINDSVLEIVEDIDKSIEGINAAIQKYELICLELKNNYNGAANEFQINYGNQYLEKLQSLSKLYSMSNYFLKYKYDEFMKVDSVKFDTDSNKR